MKCHHCGTNVEGGSRVCPECGRTLENSGGDRRDDAENEWEFGSERNGSRNGWDASRSERTPSGPTAESEIPTAEVDEPLPQDEKDKLEFPVAFPQSAGWTPVVIAGVTLLLSFLVVPLIAFTGYCSRVCRAAAKGAQEAPAFDDWGGLLKEGFLFSMAVLAFALVLTIAVLGLFFLTDATGSPVFAVLLLPVYFVGVYAIRAVMTLYAVTLDFGAALSPSNVWSLSFSADYFVTFLVEILLTVALGIVAGIAAITIVGWIWVYAYIFVATAALWGQFFYETDTSDLNLPADENSVDAGAEPAF